MAAKMLFHCIVVAGLPHENFTVLTAVAAYTTTFNGFGVVTTIPA